MDLGLQRGGVWPDEYRQEIGLEPIGTPPYQTGWISTAVQPLDESQRQPEPLPEEPDD
jgi:hypothetical protein